MNDATSDQEQHLFRVMRMHPGTRVCCMCRAPLRNGRVWMQCALCGTTLHTACVARVSLCATAAKESKTENSALRVRKSQLDEQLYADGRVAQRYESIDELGRGSAGLVLLVKERESGKEYALKVIERRGRGATLAKLEREIVLLKQLEHKRLVAMHEAYCSNDAVLLVLELMPYGDLFDRLNVGEYASGKLDESDAALVTAQLLEALSYLHARGCVHRDIKPENVLMCAPAPSVRVKLADFGLANALGDDESAQLTSVVGTTPYMAPEMLCDGEYTSAVDLWSLGVLAYSVLCRHFPFPGDSQQEELQAIVHQPLRFHARHGWPHKSASAKNFVGNLLLRNADARLSADQALRHEWILAVADALLALDSIDESQCDVYYGRAYDAAFVDKAGGAIVSKGVAVGDASASLAPRLQRFDEHLRDKERIDFSDLGELSDVVGRGASGVVYRAMFRRAPVAVKMIESANNDVLAEFLREVRLLIDLPPHPNIVTLVGVSTEPLCVVMEFYESGSLRDALMAREPNEADFLSDDDIVSILSDVAAGMMHVACEGIVHKDLAARNVLLSRGKVGVVADFGLSRFLNERTAVYDGGMCSAKWSAPEAIVQQRYSSASDVWSFGVLIVEALTRNEPLPDVSTTQFLVAFEQEQTHYRKRMLNDLLDVTTGNDCAALCALASQCLAVDPRRRMTFKEISIFLSRRLLAKSGGGGGGGGIV